MDGFCRAWYYFAGSILGGLASSEAGRSDFAAATMFGCGGCLCFAISMWYNLKIEERE